ncbi:MAG: arsenate reductase ArsC [Gammaproteobacteria bacterium]|nr:arsenate reductase ArsC [Gammaproteobacteria bacterium]MDH3857847.1 arsenate reductase ArsC [Gammaproteobacteria bacterium]
MKKVLFVCIENSCRSQMAEAFAKIYGTGVIDSYSSGSRPSGFVNEKAISAMHDIGYDLMAHESKSLDDIPQVEFEYVITMGCGDECPFVRAKNRQDWLIPDPKHMDEVGFGEVRNTIKDNVIRLIEEIKTLSRQV